MIGRDNNGKATSSILAFLDIKYLPTSIVIKNRNVLWVGNSANPAMHKVVKNFTGRDTDSEILV